ncbi:hypothetical protein QYZ87_06740 [Porphyromonadaceae bacterium W3.11]|nr:hypothetical protein [Porphyromonadaceae bacterium W3.11]
MATLINNIDINAQGIYLARHGAEELFTLPNLSDAEVNDWQEVEGLQVDFTTVQIQHPEVVVRYVVTSLAARSALEQYHKAESIKLTPHGWGRTFTLRKANADNCKVLAKGDHIMEIAYRYELDDLPKTQITSDVEPVVFRSRYKIGGVSLSQFGMVINETHALYTPDDFKALTLVRDMREAQLMCTMFASSWSVLWANRAALWDALQGELSLSTDMGTTLKARYLSCSTPKQVSQQPVISFTLNLQLI